MVEEAESVRHRSALNRSALWLFSPVKIGNERLGGVRTKAEGATAAERAGCYLSKLNVENSS